ncbi:MAG: DNA-protecting protein DprA [Clostridia bacterium]|nr:DNA-protecting protein DprA [Clostridia bacterium]
MAYTAEERAIIWLCTRTFLDEREKVALLRAAKDPSRLFPFWEEISQSVIKSEKSRVYMSNPQIREAEAEREIANMERYGIFAVTVCSDDYPFCLKQIPDPPLVLYGRGNRELLTKRKFAIVGSRITPPWAEKQTKLISGVLSKNFVVVTGFAEGGDRAAVDGALESGNLICVLPQGLDGCYPAGHASLKERVAEKGLLLSEYPLKTSLRKHHFHARNRILAGLTEGVLVVSGKLGRSGTLITASFALEYGRDVFAFPYNLGVDQGSGCNDLIKKGAYLATGAEDILSAYGMKTEEKEEISLTEEERVVYSVLKEGGELHATVIAERAGLQVYEIAAVLSSLEMKNLVVRAGGNRYAAI